MFFIVNKTKGHVTLGDIGINLGPKQAIDLDKVMGRAKSNESRSLRAASKRGDIEIRVKDKPKSKAIPNTKPRSNDLGDMKAEIIGEMKNTMRELLKGQSGGVSKEDLQALIDSIPKATETVIYRHEGAKIREDEEVEIDEGTLGEISKRAMDKMVKNAESKEIKYKEEKQENDLMDNINELEQLFG